MAKQRGWAGAAQRVYRTPLTIRPILALSFLTLPVAAQTVTLTGAVVHAETGERFAGVNVFVSGTTHGVATGGDVAFALDRLHPGSLTVAAPMVGFQTDV